MQLNYTCDTCDAEFKIKHSMDETFFEVTFCPFCGAEITGEDDELEEDD